MESRRLRSELVQPSERFAASQPTPNQSRTQRRNEGAREHRTGQLRELREKQHELAVGRQEEWSSEEAWRDPRDLAAYVWCGRGKDEDDVERETKTFSAVEREILKAEAKLDKHRRHGPFVRISPIFSETRLAPGKNGSRRLVTSGDAPAPR